VAKQLAATASAKSQILYLTMDTDWCSEEVLQYALALFQAHDLPCTIFVTGRYEALRHYEASRLEIGLHPNFNETTSGGYEAKLRELCEIYPDAQGVASHAMLSSTSLLALFKQYGFKYDRNLLFYKNPAATAFYHYNGLLRLPVFWEDDIWFSAEPGAPFSADLLGRDRFRYLFNFHPIHLYLNTESPAHYHAFKPFQHEPEKLARHIGKGYGVRSYFEDLVQHIKQNDLATGLLREFIES
jgi:hypothetical protein